MLHFSSIQRGSVILDLPLNRNSLKFVGVSTSVDIRNSSSFNKILTDFRSALKTHIKRQIIYIENSILAANRICKMWCNVEMPENNLCVSTNSQQILLVDDVNFITNWMWKTFSPNRFCAKPINYLDIHAIWALLNQ